MKLSYRKDAAPSGSLSRTLRYSAALSMPLVASFGVSCASITPGLAHPAVTPHSATSVVAPKSAAEAKSDSLKAAVASKQAAQARSASKTPYLDATIAELYAHDSARGVLTAAICEEHGPQLRSVKEKNSRNNVFLAALEDLFITLEEAPSALRGCAGYIDNKESSVSLVDEPRSPNKMLRISPLGSYGVRFDILHYGSDSVVSHVSQYTGTPVYVRVRSDSVSYSLTEKTSVEDFSLLKMALSRFAGTVINLTTLNGFVSK